LGKAANVITGSTKKSINETFNRVLEYENEAVPTTALGFGVTTAFTAATKFNAPDNGFYLSHFKTWFRPTNWLKSVIKYEIRTGANMANSKIVATGEFTHEIAVADETGSFITIGLQQPILMFPNETFYVVVTYPLGIDFPQGTATLPAPKADYFFYPSDGNWIDLTSHDEFNGMGWMMKALEKDAKTGFWAEITGGNTGEVAKGESKTFDVNFDASFAAHGLQSAKVYFNTNDPVHRADSLELQLYLNQGPVFTEYPKDILVVNENNLLSFNFKVADLENNTFTVELDGTYTGVTLTKGATDYNVSYTPTFESGRTMEVKIKATDSNGYTNTLKVNISIVDVNRAPVVKTIADRGYKTGAIFDRIPLSSVFTDPDGDKLSYEILVSNPDVMQIGIIGTDFILMPQTNGKADISISATDGKSDKVNANFKIYVNADGTVSVIENKAEIAEASIYPNPMRTNATLNLVLHTNAKLQVSITDITGHVVRELVNENTVAGNKTVEISKEKLSSGMYLIRIAIDNSVITRKLMVD
ncbi:MAG TPA: hypothetical protein DCQ31_17690, partial [Bacteroidales bacterium]|nr:hypothetical protein [Bacteroidales bacterium]